MRVLVACEYSGTVSEAFRQRGHEVYSCDLLPTESESCQPWHVVGDALAIINDPAGWDLMVAHPPCTDLAAIGAKFWAEKQEDGRQQAAINFFMTLYNAPIARIAVENPVGIMSKAFRKPDQYVNPWQFGDPWRKKTGLWLRGLPPLTPEIAFEPAGVGYWVDGTTRPRSEYASHSSQAGSYGKSRSKFFPGIARAMAEQWG